MEPKKSNKGRKNNGDGSVYQTSPTKWVAKIYLGKKSNEKPDYKSFSGKTESIAKRKLKEFKKERGLFSNVKESGVTLKDYIIHWMQTYRKLELKPTSYDRLESTINQHIIPNLGYLQLTTVTHSEIQYLIKKLLESKKSYSSIKKVYNALNACYNHAMMLGDVSKNPCFGITIPSELNFDKKEIIFFSEADIEKIKDEVHRTYSTQKEIYIYGDAYILILNTGLRIGEILALQWKDVNLENKTLKVNGNVVMTKNRKSDGVTPAQGYTLQRQRSTKTNAGDGRIVNLNNNAVEALSRLKHVDSQQYVVVNSKNKNVPPHNFERTFYRVLENINLPKCGVHSLRHTFASLLFKKGVEVKTIS